MSRLALPLEVADLSAFARSLRDQLEKLEHKPGHVELLNMLCRAAGFRNYQHFRGPSDRHRRLNAHLALSGIPFREGTCHLPG